MGDEWAKGLVGKWVLHGPTRVIGEVVKFYDGEAEVHISRLNGEPVKGPVLELSSGHTFVANEEAAFAELTRQARDFYQTAQKAVSGVLMHLAKMGGHIEGLGVEQGAALLVIALREQAMILEHGMKVETRVSTPGSEVPSGG